MKICIAGKNSIAINAVKYILDNNILPSSQICCVPNKTDNGKDSWQQSFLKFVIGKKIKIVSLEDLYSLKNIVFFSLQFDRLIKTNMFVTDKLYNIHFSLLPAYKGMHTSIIPILNGEKKSGVTLHYIDDGIDTGAIIDQREFCISSSYTAKNLYEKYLLEGYEIFKKNIRNILNKDKVSAVAQVEIGSSYYSKQSIDFSNIDIDFNKTSYEINNQIRAYIFEEYQLPQINKVKIRKTTLTSEFIGRNFFKEFKDRFELSGIDGFKIVAKK